MSVRAAWPARSPSQVALFVVLFVPTAWVASTNPGARRHVVTWSIIARDGSSGQFGIAVATRFFAVGALVPHVASRVGAIATQALINPFFGTKGLDLLRAGKSAAETVEILVAADPGRDHRQL